MYSRWQAGLRYLAASTGHATSSMPAPRPQQTDAQQRGGHARRPGLNIQPHRWSRHHNELTCPAQRAPAVRKSECPAPSPDLGRTISAQIPERAAHDVAREVAQQYHILDPPRAARDGRLHRAAGGILARAVTAGVVIVRGRQRVEMLLRHDRYDIGLATGCCDSVQREAVQRREWGEVLQVGA
jgi:hypothetical protein